MPQERFKASNKLLLLISILCVSSFLGVIFSLFRIEAKQPVKNDTGMIEGTISYPASEIPEDLTICAINQDTHKKFCTKMRITDTKYDSGFGYRIEVPVGNYQVLSFLPANPFDKAYYSQFIKCTNNFKNPDSEGCTSHTPITITVSKGETIYDITPGDWYN